MTRVRLVLRNLFYHWRGNSAVLLGVAVGTAVLAGALLVGDSLRGSLRDVTLQQLAWVDHTLVTGRFFRQDLAREVDASMASPAILLQASATGATTAPGQEQAAHRARKVAVVAVDSSFWRGSEGAAPLDPAFWDSAKEEAVLNAALAEDLGVGVGDTITLHLQKVSLVPRETLLGKRDIGDVVEDLPLRVAAIVANEGQARFSLNPNPATPRNAFVPLHALQAKLHQEKRVNAILAGGADSQRLHESLRKHLTLDDWGLVLHSPASRAKDLFDKLDRNHDGKLTANEYRRRVADTFVKEADQNHDGVLDREEVNAFYRKHRNYLSLESRQMLLEPAVAEAALAAAKDTGLTPAPTFVYLANRIAAGDKAIPYSIVAALDPSLPSPLGPFLAAGAQELKDNEIILADWKDSPLHARPGDAIIVKYFEPEEGQLRETTANFRLRARVPLQGVASDPDLTPEFPGITDKLDLREWNPPFPYDNKLVQDVDERYWEEYRTTPKAYVSLAEGQRLWGSRFGRLTSIRLAEVRPGDKETGRQGDGETRRQGESRLPWALENTAESFRKQLLLHLRPEQGGLVFDPVRQRSLEGSAGANDFGWLFLGFSGFLIVAALLLVGLLFRLNMDRRAQEMGVLLAMGYRRRTVRWLLLAEGSLLALLGAVLGLAGALAYGWMMLEFLRVWWPGTLDRSFLRLHVTGLSLAIGYAGALVVSILTIAWAVRILGGVSPRALLSGATAEEPVADLASGSTKGRRRWSPWVTIACGVGAIVLLVLGRYVQGHEERAITFFGSGALLLTASLAAVWWWMSGAREGTVHGSGRPGLLLLGIRNAARNPARSLLTAGLLASATFLVVAVQSFYRDPGKDFLAFHSGSGGFALLAETDLPIYQDLNSAKGLDELNFPARLKPQLQGATFFPFRLHAGDDASCLNLYQPRRPRLLGVPQRLIQRGGFQFAGTEANSPEAKANPWLLLNGPRPEGAIPVFGEANTVTYMLHSKLGGELEVPDEHGEPVRLRVVGLLQDSVFQSSLLLADTNLLKLHPRDEGFEFFLLEVAPQRVTPVRTVLETNLADYGFTVTPTAQRLESYLAIENTYLSTFQALGGLGLVLGALGLAVVLLRSVWERRGELALLRALGFRKTTLAWLVLAENGFLLILGLLVGTASALLAVAPHLIEARGQVPWVYLGYFLAVVLLVGWLAGAVAVAVTLRAPLIPALRRE